MQETWLLLNEFVELLEGYESKALLPILDYLFSYQLAEEMDTVRMMAEMLGGIKGIRGIILHYRSGFYDFDLWRARTNLTCMLIGSNEGTNGEPTSHIIELERSCLIFNHGSEMYPSTDGPMYEIHTSWSTFYTWPEMLNMIHGGQETEDETDPDWPVALSE